LSASATSHHDLFSEAFITNIAVSEFSAHTGSVRSRAAQPSRR
jgi:hypothetical protein